MLRHRFFKFYFKFKKMPGIPSKIGQGFSLGYSGIRYSASALRSGLT